MLGIYGTVYNSEDTVKQTIESLKSSLKEDFIIVVTDNFSKDRTYEILNQYDFVYVLRKKCKRGRGRQIALEYLIKNFEPDFIFYIDFDLIFPEFFGEVIEKIKENYKENEVWLPFGIASYETYKKILERVKWRDLNVMEDHLWTRDLILNGFKVKWLCIPLFLNQIREKREKKYEKGIKYIFRKIGIYKDYVYYLLCNLIKIRRFKIEKWQFERVDIILPEEIRLEKDLFFFAEKFIPEKLKEKLKDEKIYIYRGRKFVYLFRSEKIIEFVKNKIFIVEGLKSNITFSTYP